MQTFPNIILFPLEQISSVNPKRRSEDISQAESAQVRGKRGEGERRKCGDTSRLRARVPRDEAKRTTLRPLYFCTTPFLSSSLGAARYRDSRSIFRRSQTRTRARLCSHARSSQKYVILLFISMHHDHEVSSPFSRNVWSIVKPLGTSAMLRTLLKIT